MRKTGFAAILVVTWAVGTADTAVVHTARAQEVQIPQPSSLVTPDPQARIAVSADGDVSKLNDYFLRTGASYFPPPESQEGWRKLEEPGQIRRLRGRDPDKLESLKQWLLESDNLNRAFAAVVIRRGYVVLEIEKGVWSKY